MNKQVLVIVVIRMRASREGLKKTVISFRIIIAELPNRKRKLSAIIILVTLLRAFESTESSWLSFHTVSMALTCL